MHILFLAPQPYYQERGTVIAVDLLTRALCERGDTVDMLTLHLGQERTRENLKVHRVRPWLAPKTVRPGFSHQKVWCDLFMLVKAIRMARTGQYDLVHAVEEAAFIAWLLKLLFRLPFVYDMDSSMASQIMDRYRWSRPLAGLLRAAESLPMRSALAVIPMCEDLAIVARRHCRGLVQVLSDVSLVGESTSDARIENLRESLGLPGTVLMYIGNLEPYQGIDLMLEAFRRVAESDLMVALVIIGGSATDMESYQAKVTVAKLAERVHLIGPRPVGLLGHYMSQADIMLSPRTQGTNTPMKIYSYMDSGRAIVATKLPTHTQVLSDGQAALVTAEAGAMATAILSLLDNPGERLRLAAAAQAVVRERHSWAVFKQCVDQIYGELAGRLT